MSQPSNHLNIYQFLDVVRADSEDLRDPDLSAVARAVQTSSELRTEFASRQQFDRVVGKTMRDVEIPPHLRQSLLASLHKARTVTGMPIPSSQRRVVTSRRAALAVLASLVLGFATWMIWPHGPQALTLDEIRHSLPVSDRRLAWERLESFDYGFEARLPDSEWESIVDESVKGLDLNGDGRHDAAVIPWALSSSRPRGYLLVLPASLLDELPSPTRLTPAGLSYVPVPNTAWKSIDGKMVYVCFVEEGRLDQLQSQLYGGSA